MDFVGYADCLGFQDKDGFYYAQVSGGGCRTRRLVGAIQRKEQHQQQ